jgi:cytochrome c553
VRTVAQVDRSVEDPDGEDAMGMQSIMAAVSVAFVVAFFGPSASAEPPGWAFAVNPPGQPSMVDDGTPRQIPGSTQSYTATALRDLYNVPDWHPDDHPPMPEVVAHGRKPDVFACGFCHLPNGLGRPENASLAGLPAEYIVQQVADFKSGDRKSSEPRDLPVKLMIATAKAATDEEVRAAATYFAGLPRRPWIKVVETETVPATHVAGWMLVAATDGAVEPIGRRIIETPVDLNRTELRDSQSPFLAYVPPGSIARGAALASTGGVGKTVPCSICHGADLRGLGPVPPLAGRSPSYIVRQLYDMRNGARDGLWTPLMAGIIANLDEDDFIAVSAYTASLPP